MITPTIGRVIWYQPSLSEDQDRLDQPWPAFITFVHDDGKINVAGFSSNGGTFNDVGITLIQDDETPPELAAYAEWMPYQKAQAASA